MRVAHFIRKSSQLNSSFIANQIKNHIDYKPYLIFRKNNLPKLYSSELDLSNYVYLDLSIDETWFEKFLFKTIKILSNRQIKIINKFISQNQIDICHFHYGTDCGIFSPLLKMIQIPSLVSFYGYDCSSFPNAIFGYGRLYLKRRVFNNITMVLAMSPDMEKDLRGSGCPKNKLIVHYYGTDVNLFYGVFKSSNDKEKKVILNLCSLVPQKGQLFLLNSIAKLVREGVSNFQLRIVGAGILENELKEFIEKHNLSTFVTMVGAIPYGGIEMKREYQNADIFVHPSVIAPNGDKEGIPGAIIEAMSSALPVISTYHAGIPYIIKNKETGILVEEHNIDSLSKALLELLQNPFLQKKYGLAGQQYANENLDVKLKEKELENIYSSLIKK